MLEMYFMRITKCYEPCHDDFVNEDNDKILITNGSKLNFKNSLYVKTIESDCTIFAIVCLKEFVKTKPGKISSLDKLLRR